MADGIEGKVARGVVTKLLGNTPLQVVKLLLTILCLRWLTPDAYGVYTLALAIFGFSDLVTSPGIAIYLIRNPKCSDRAIDVAWSFSVVRGALLSGAFYLVAPSLAGAFSGDPKLTSMLRILSLSFFLIGLKNLQTVRFHQQLRFGIALVADSLGGLIATLVSIALLFRFREPTVLIVGSVVGYALDAAVTWRLAPARVRFSWDWRELGEMWRFSRYILLNSAIIYAHLNLDDLLVARLVGTAALGVYAMSYGMVNSALLFITRPLGELLLPTLSRLLDDRPAFTRATRAAISAFSAISWGIIAALWVLAHDLFEALGNADSWQGASPIFRALLPFVLVRGINQSLGAMVVAAGKPKVLTVVSGVQLLLMIPIAYAGLLIAGFIGLTVAITVLALAAGSALIVISPWFIKAPRRHLVALALVPALPAWLAAGTAWGVTTVLPAAPLRLAVGGGVALALYAILWELICRMRWLSSLDGYPLSTLYKNFRKGNSAQANPSEAR